MEDDPCRRRHTGLSEGGQASLGKADALFLTTSSRSEVGAALPLAFGGSGESREEEKLRGGAGIARRIETA